MFRKRARNIKKKNHCIVSMDSHYDSIVKIAVNIVNIVIYSCKLLAFIHL